MILVRGEFKRGFVKAAVSGAVRLLECPLRELWLYNLSSAHGHLFQAPNEQFSLSSTVLNDLLVIEKLYEHSLNTFMYGLLVNKLAQIM